MDTERDAALAAWASLKTGRSLDEVREKFDALGEDFGVEPGVSVTQIQVGALPAEWLAVGGASANTVLYLHGGGYSTGSVRSHRHLGARIAKSIGGSVMVIDYRLAPEHIFPAALDDALAAYDYLVRERGIVPSRIALVGDSAGGNLAMALMLALRDKGNSLPACAVCMSPWTDYLGESPSGVSKADVDPVISRERSMEVARMYFANTDMKAAPASVLHADLSRLPPLLIQVGTHETLLDDAIRLATRAAHADVAVTLEAWPRMPHVFPHFFPILTQGREALDNGAAFITRHLHG